MYTKITINTFIEKGKGLVESSESTALSGDEIIITLKPENDYELENLTVNGESLKHEVVDNKLKIKCKDKDLDIKLVIYKKENITTIIDVPSPKDDAATDNSEIITNNPATKD